MSFVFLALCAEILPILSEHLGVFDAFLVVECLVLVVEQKFLDIRAGDERLQRLDLDVEMVEHPLFAVFVYCLPDVLYSLRVVLFKFVHHRVFDTGVVRCTDIRIRLRLP